MNPDTLATVEPKDEELRHFDTKQAFSEASVDEEICIKKYRKESEVHGTSEVVAEHDLRAHTGKNMLVQHIPLQQNGDRVRAMISGSTRVPQGR